MSVPDAIIESRQEAIITQNTKAAGLDIRRQGGKEMGKGNGIKRRNVILMYADDLGFGDLNCYGSCRVETPNLSRLCEEGLKFYNAYSASAVCTPARYGILTGRYPFRNDRAHILPGDAQCIIERGTRTIADLFRSSGYRTGIVGKWHLGLSDGSAPIDWNRDINVTPLDFGFDESFIFPATADRVPCIYVDGRSVANLDPQDPIAVSYEAECPFEGIHTYHNDPGPLRMLSSHGHDNSVIGGIGRIGYMRGGQKALWRDEDLAETFLKRALDFIAESQKEERPFFLYYALHQPHVPRVPSERFRGVSKLGPRGDVIAEMDWCVGELMDRLDNLGIREETIIIFSSDNGPVLDDGYQDNARELNGTHRPAGPLRGGKYSRYEGGTRVPFLISCPGFVRRGVTDALISQVDLYASFAEMLGVTLSEKEAVDSHDVLAALIGESPRGREEVLTEDLMCRKVLRRNNWVYLTPGKGSPYMEHVQIETGASLDPQLYCLDYDLGQQSNVAWEHEELIEEMEKRLQEILRSEGTR